jgi:methyl coenzyme M reductase subunit C
LLSLQAFEAVSASRLEREPCGALGEVASGARHENLARSRLVHDAGGGVHRQASDVVTAHGHLSTMDADPDRELDRGKRSD